MSSLELSEEENRHVASTIRETLARRRRSRRWLAEESQLGLSTLEKGLAGSRPFTLATLVRLEEALGVPLRARGSVAAPSSDLDLGGYSRGAVEGLTGTYLTIRPSFEQGGALYAYLTEIRWDEERSCLAFSESGRLDTAFAQKGYVSVPHQSGQIYLVTNDHGQFRLIILSRPTIAGDMHGLLTTLQSGRGGRLTPIASPVVLCRQTEADPRLGRLELGDPTYDACLQRLTRTLDEEFARLVAPGATASSLTKA